MLHLFRKSLSFFKQQKKNMVKILTNPVSLTLTHIKF